MYGATDVYLGKALRELNAKKTIIPTQATLIIEYLWFDLTLKLVFLWHYCAIYRPDFACQITLHCLFRTHKPKKLYGQVSIRGLFVSTCLVQRIAQVKMNADVD